MLQMNCIKCNYYSDCSCSFNGQYCHACYHSNNVEKIQNCTYTKEDLSNLKTQLQKKTPLKNLTRYQISIINSQLAAFDKNPCKFSNIIQNISLN